MNRILIVTHDMSGAWFSIPLEEEGNHVDIWLQDNYEYYSPVLSGLVKSPLKAKPSFKNYDLVLFDLTDRPELAEEASKVTNVIGDGNLNTEIENNRQLAIEVMEQCDIKVPFYEAFDDISEAKKFIRKTNKRYVFKPDDFEDQNKASTYVSKSAEDMLEYIDKVSATVKGVPFILQEVVQGTEISTEAWFNGDSFHLITGTLEEKKLMNDNKGPNTGCAGNLEIVYDQTNPPLVFREGLRKAQDFLQQYNFKGYIDLNSIVDDRGNLYGLEWTPRFGYDCTATLFSTVRDITDLIGSIATGGVPVVSTHGPFAAGLRISIPPYPSEIKGFHPEGVPIEGIEEDDIPKNCFLYDCGSDKSGTLCTVGAHGFVCVPVYPGNTLQEAWGRVKSKVEKINIPDMQYRTDLEETTLRRYKKLMNDGWLR